MTGRPSSQELADRVGLHECATCRRCATTYAIVHPFCPKCAVVARLQATEQALRNADAVAMIWATHALDDDPRAMMELRFAAHPLSCVRTAIAGETDPAQLGCTADELRVALHAAGDIDAFRRALEGATE